MRWPGKPGLLEFMGSQRIGHDLATKQQPPLVSTTQGILRAPSSHYYGVLIHVEQRNQYPLQMAQCDQTLNFISLHPSNGEKKKRQKQACIASWIRNESETQSEVWGLRLKAEVETDWYSLALSTCWRTRARLTA